MTAPKSSADPPRVYYVDGVPAQASARYRVFNALEQLRLAGAEGVLLPQDYDPDEVFSGHGGVPGVLVIHRAPWDERLAALIEAARSKRIRVLYDIDDLVFEPIAMPWVRALSRLSDVELDLYEDGMKRYLRALKSCDGVLTTTRALASYAAAEGVPVFVHRNGLDQRSLDTARAARQARGPRDEIVLYYGAGTATHDIDFQACGPALERLLHKYPSLYLLMQGDIELGYGLELFGDRVRRWPWMPWPDYFWGIAQADINLAPLELGNPFCEVKSELKWFEAALMGIPTVASATEAFGEAIRTGDNGFLAATQSEWFDTLQELINDGERRRSVGLNAESDVLNHYQPAVMGRHLEDLLRRVATAEDLTDLVGTLDEGSAVRTETGAQRKPKKTRTATAAQATAALATTPQETPTLTIGWLATAPVRGGGGTRNILRMARHLQSFGHKVTLYVEPLGLFRSENELTSFIATNFPGDTVPIRMGLENTSPSDALIATLWLTAERLRDIGASRGKFYLVQDFEPYFYAMGEEHLRAEATYKLGFHHITSGRWCTQYLREHYSARADYFDFPLDRSIYYPRPAARKRPGPRVIFFSRPEMPRRCYNLGIQALARLKARLPEAQIILFGSDEVDSRSVPFPCEVLKNIPDLDKLAELYSSADAALVLSTTNTSLVPFEVAACGCPVVDIDLEVNRVNYLGSDAMSLAAAEPGALADALYQLLDDPDLHKKHREAGLRLAELLPNEEQAARRVEEILLQGLGLISAPEGLAPAPVSLNGGRRRLDGLALDVTCRREDGVLGELQPGKKVVQTFQSNDANLAAIAVKAALYGRPNAASLEMSLYEETTKVPLQQIRQSLLEASDNGWIVFRFPALTDSAGKRYRFVLSSPDATAGNACGLYHARESFYREGSLRANGRADKGALVFQTFVQRTDVDDIQKLIRPERALLTRAGGERGENGATSFASPSATPTSQLQTEVRLLRQRLERSEQRQADVALRVTDLHNFLSAIRGSLPYRGARKVARTLGLRRKP